MYEWSLSLDEIEIYVVQYSISLQVDLIVDS